MNKPVWKRRAGARGGHGHFRFGTRGGEDGRWPSAQDSLGTARKNAENLGKRLLGRFGQMLFNNNVANQQTAKDIAASL